MEAAALNKTGSWLAAVKGLCLCNLLPDLAMANGISLFFKKRKRKEERSSLAPRLFLLKGRRAVPVFKPGTSLSHYFPSLP